MIGLLSCSAQKLPRAAPAARLYSSTLFQMSLRYLLRTCSRVYVLSAKHGLVNLDDVLEPYDLQLTKLSLVEQRRWGMRVVSELARDNASRENMVALAGMPYIRALRLWLPYGWYMNDPLQGMQIGQRLAWLSRANALLDDAEANRRTLASAAVRVRS